MKEFEYTITKPEGLHARPAGMLVKKAKDYASRITLLANGKECDATRLLTLMAMCIKCGTTVKVRIEGDDEILCADDHKAVISLIKIAAENAHKHGIEIGICGELASRPELIEKWTELEIDYLSVSPYIVNAKH